VEEPFKQLVLDIRNKNNISTIIKEINPNYIVHLAASTSRLGEINMYRTVYETNVIGSLNLIESCLVLKDLRKFVFLGSCEEYGPHSVPFCETHMAAPNTAYGLSKLAITLYLHEVSKIKQFHSLILRPTVVYGPGQKPEMFLPSLIKALLVKQSFPMTLGDQTRDFIYIDDLVNSVMLAMESDKLAKGQTINISSGTPIKIKTLAEKVAQFIGEDCMGLVEFGAIDYRFGEAFEYWGSNQLARDWMGWCPETSLDDGLKKTIEYFSKQKTPCIKTNEDSLPF